LRRGTVEDGKDAGKPSSCGKGSGGNCRGTRPLSWGRTGTRGGRLGGKNTHTPKWGEETGQKTSVRKGGRQQTIKQNYDLIGEERTGEGFKKMNGERQTEPLLPRSGPRDEREERDLRRRGPSDSIWGFRREKGGRSLSCEKKKNKKKKKNGYTTEGGKKRLELKGRRKGTNRGRGT